MNKKMMDFANLPFEILIRIALYIDVWEDMYVFTVLNDLLLELRHYRPLAVYARRQFEEAVYFSELKLAMSKMIIRIGDDRVRVCVYQFAVGFKDK